MGGAHHDPQKMAQIMKETIKRNLEELRAIDKEELLKLRYKKYRNMGVVE
jgi:acetyl-CoA carboxylase carboxyl transferase subunit alpha